MASEQLDDDEQFSFLKESYRRRKNQGKKVKPKQPFQLSQEVETLSQAKTRAKSFGHKIRDRRPFDEMWDNDKDEDNEDNEEEKSPELTKTNPSAYIAQNNNNNNNNNSSQKSAKAHSFDVNLDKLLLDCPDCKTKKSISSTTYDILSHTEPNIYKKKYNQATCDKCSKDISFIFHCNSGKHKDGYDLCQLCVLKIYKSSDK